MYHIFTAKCKAIEKYNLPLANEISKHLRNQTLSYHDPIKIYKTQVTANNFQVNINSSIPTGIQIFVQYESE